MRKKRNFNFAAGERKKKTSGAMRCMREINAGQSMGSRCVVVLRLLLI